MSRRPLWLVALVLVLAACGPADTASGPAGAGAPPPAETEPALPAGLSLVAQARDGLKQVGIYEAPGAPAPSRTLEHPQRSGAPLVFLARDRRPGWLQVLLPVRPNGSTGWVRQEDVTTYTHDYRIVVELAAHRITVHKGRDVFLQEPIGVGTRDTPTPNGLYYTKELLQPTDERGRYIPEGPYGPYAYGLSGFSNVLTSFAGGDGVVGIHGTNQPSLLGKDVSHGCIRMSNAGITRLAKVLPLGVPVEIRP